MKRGGMKYQAPRLPACQSCYTKKAKCDNGRPKCTPCTRNSHACYTVSVNGSEPVLREYIYELEQRAENSQAESSEAQIPNDFRSPAVMGQLPEVRERRTENELDSSPNVTEGTGISFMSLLFTDSRWREQNLKLLQNLSKSSAILETSVQPNPLPSVEEAQEMFDSYLNESHVQNPFLLRRDVQRLYHSVFLADHSAQQATRLLGYDMFRAFMILAIGSIRMYRTGTHKDHPYGYYLTAMQHLDRNILLRGINAIQDILLVARFGIYHHIGTSIWELTTVCIGMCIEQGLHKSPRQSSRRKISLLHEQLQRRVFWECYMIDRYSSITLDRPAAIADEDIQVGFPVDANDEDIDAADSSGTFANLDSFCQATTTRPTPEANTEISIFLLCLRLRKITSKIQKRFRQKTEHASGVTNQLLMESITTSGKIYANLDELLSELEEWRDSAPIFTNPRSLYETQEWYDLLLIREKLLLVRKAIDLVPKHSNNIPPQDLISICLEYSIRIITQFSAMFERKQVTYTRSYFQMLFTAGLSVMYCISVVMDNGSGTVVSAAKALQQGEKTLKEMGKDLPDALHYVAVYEALRVNVLGKLSITPEQYQTAAHTGDTRGHDMSGVERLQQQQQQHPAQSSDNWFLSSNEPLLNDQPLGTSFLPWDSLLGDSTFWDMETGLGEYAYGDAMLLFSNITEDNE